MNSGWGYVISLLNVEISLKCVTTGHLPSAPIANYHQRNSSTQKYSLDWCRFRHRSQVDAYVDIQCTVSSHLDKSSWF